MEWKVEVGSSSLGKTLRRSFREQSKTPRQGAVLQRLGWGIRPCHDHPPAFWFIQRLYAKAFRPSLLNMNVHPCWISALCDLSQSTSSLPFKNWTIATEKLEWPLKAPRQALQSFRAWNADQFCTSKIFKIRRPQPFAGGARPRKSGFAAPLAAQQHVPALLAAQQQVLWPPAGRFPWHFLLVSESNVRHWAGLKPPPAP